MRVGSLFTGCAGLDLGLQLAGHEIVWGCENNKFCRTVLAEHWPDLEVYEDIREVVWEEVAAVDLLAGGFPCQDLSQAGKGAGLAGERSALWYEFARAIRALRPRHVLIENVAGFASKMGSRPGESALASVIADLAEAGYVGRWFRLRSCDIGAPHRRERIFILAQFPGSWKSSADAGRERLQGPGHAGPTEQEPARAGLALTDAGSERFDWSGIANQEGSAGEGNRRSVTTRSQIFAADRNWGKFQPAIVRWERIFGREAPRATDERGRLDPAFVEWMLGLPADWTAAVSRSQRLRMLGNACQPQVIQLVSRILEYSTLGVSGDGP